jgi:hypothetical protein
LSEREQGYLEQSQRWDLTGRGYTAIQSTRPQTLGYALNDSPAGLAAWILEKWRSWSDCGGDLESRFSRDFLLSVVTLYWVTGSITSSMRDYYDNRRWQGEPRLLERLGPAALVELTVFIGFANLASRVNTAHGITSQGYSDACEIPQARRPEKSGVASTA